MSIQCLANTNQGKRCTRNATPGSLFCYQHEKKVGDEAEPKESEDEFRKKLLINPKKWKNVDLEDIPFTEFKQYKPKMKVTSPSEDRGRTLTKKSKSLYSSPQKTTNVKKESNKSPKECCVCMEKSEDTLKCKHTICVDCTKQLYNPICPLCRRNLEGPTITKEILNTIEENKLPRRRISPISIDEYLEHARRFPRYFSRRSLSRSRSRSRSRSPKTT
jgi:hypothetical protein